MVDSEEGFWQFVVDNTVTNHPRTSDELRVFLATDTNPIWTLLRKAAHGGVWASCPSFVARLLAHGADVNHMGISGHTALCHAAYNGNDESVRILLEHGAQVDLCKPPSSTPLDYACRNHCVMASRLLLDYGADYRRLPLYEACEEKDAEIDALLEATRARETRAHQTCIVLLGVLRRLYMPKDLRRLLGRLVWAGRRNEEWDFP